MDASPVDAIILQPTDDVREDTSYCSTHLVPLWYARLAVVPSENFESSGKHPEDCSGFTSVDEDRDAP